MGYDRGDSFPSDFEANGIPFGSKSKVKLSLRSYPIQCERKWKYSFLSVGAQSGLSFSSSAVREAHTSRHNGVPIEGLP